MIPQRYKKPLIIAAATTVVYALLGFFLAPWLIKNTAINTVRDNLGTELKLQKVSVNPFVLSLQIDALALDEPGGDPFLTVERIFINFQLSSLFRWAVTFREVHIDSPKLRLARDGNGDFNFDFFAQQPNRRQSPVRRVCSSRTSPLPRASSTGRTTCHQSRWTRNSGPSISQYPSSIPCPTVPASRTS
jgi:uncharacterized protein involved in outer membrane biogenesis